MKYAFAQVAFGLGVNALVAREATQCIQLKVSGGQSGILGQLTDGQNRVGGGHPTGCYCLSSGGFTDSQSRGCILTAPTSQFQCDTGAKPTTGFAVGSSGSVTYNGSSKFYACPATDSEYNVYTTPVSGQTKCVEISLSSAGTCGSSSTQSSAAASSSAKTSAVYPTAKSSAMSTSQPDKSSVMSQSAKTSVMSQSMKSSATPKASSSTQGYPAQGQSTAKSSPSSAAKSSAPVQSTPVAMPSATTHSASAPASSATASSGNKCPTDLNGAYQYPHLIIPVDSEQPSKAFGTSYNGLINNHTCSIFNFDIPTSYSGKTCSVVFLFPLQKDLQTSSFTVSGSGSVDFTQLKTAATQQTTYANQPSKESDLVSMAIAPGNSYMIATGTCAAGQTVSYEICSSGTYSLNYFQDYNPSPIGLYVRQC